MKCLFSSSCSWSGQGRCCVPYFTAIVVAITVPLAPRYHSASTAAIRPLSPLGQKRNPGRCMPGEVRKRPDPFVSPYFLPDFPGIEFTIPRPDQTIKRRVLSVHQSVGTWSSARRRIYEYVRQASILRTAISGSIATSEPQVPHLLALLALLPVFEIRAGSRVVVLIVLRLMLLPGLASGARDRFNRRQIVPVRLSWSLEILNAVRLRVVENAIVVRVHGLPPPCRSIPSSHVERHSPCD